MELLPKDFGPFSRDSLKNKVRVQVNGLILEGIFLNHI